MKFRVSVIPGLDLICARKRRELDGRHQSGFTSPGVCFTTRRPMIEENMDQRKRVIGSRALRLW